MSEKPDPRVEAIKDGLCSLEVKVPVDVMLKAATSGLPIPVDEFAAAALAALESAGWRIVRLEQVGIICDDGSILPIPGEDDEQYDDDVPVYTVIEEGPA